MQATVINIPEGIGQTGAGDLLSFKMLYATEYDYLLFFFNYISAAGMTLTVSIKDSSDVEQASGDFIFASAASLTEAEIQSLDISGLSQGRYTVEISTSAACTVYDTVAACSDTEVTG